VDAPVCCEFTLQCHSTPMSAMYVNNAIDTLCAWDPDWRLCLGGRVEDCRRDVRFLDFRPNLMGLSDSASHGVYTHVWFPIICAGASGLHFLTMQSLIASPVDDGPCSARFACLYLTACGLNNVNACLLSYKILPCRYRGHIHIIDRIEVITPNMDAVLLSWQRLYQIPWQFEGFGSESQVLVCCVTMEDNIHSHAIHRKHKTKSTVN
jgi:hypothetical protein